MDIVGQVGLEEHVEGQTERDIRPNFTGHVMCSACASGLFNVSNPVVHYKSLLEEVYAQLCREYMTALFLTVPQAALVNLHKKLELTGS